MKRRGIITAALCAAVLLSGGCTQAELRHFDVRRDLSVYFANADSVIDAMRQGFAQHSAGITVTYRSSSDNMEDIPAVMRELVRFALSETDDPREGDYIYHQYGGYELGYNCTETDGSYSYEITVIPDYYTTPAQEETVTERVREVLSSLELDGKSEAQKAAAIYGWVYDNVSYDKVHRKNPHYHLKSTAYAALVNGCAVCQGYSVLMYRLLREAGLDCRVITGYAHSGEESEYHAWNIVRLGTAYYNIDVTWDRQRGTHDFFLKGESGFSETHIRDAEFSSDGFLAQYPMSENDYDEI